MSEQTYESAYGGGTIRAAQYLAEVACVRKASREGIDLPQKFWTLPRWKREFALQAMYANAVLKMYPEKTVVKVFLEQKWSYSINSKALDPYFKERLLEECAQKESKLQEKETQFQPTKPASEVKLRPTFKKDSLEGL